MAASLSVASILEKNRIESGVPFLALLDIEVIDPATGAHVETLYVVLNDEPVTFNGNEYVPTIFDITLKSEVNVQTSLDLTINDFSQALQARMQAYGGGVGFNVTLSVVDGSALDLPAELVDYFQILTASAADYKASFTLGAGNSLTDMFPRRRQTRDFCQWRFKDENCGYAGPLTTCDYTLNGGSGCSKKGVEQVVRFGAYPGINSNGYRYA